MALMSQNMNGVSIRGMLMAVAQDPHANTENGDLEHLAAFYASMEQAIANTDIDARIRVDTHMTVIDDGHAKNTSTLVGSVLNDGHWNTVATVQFATVLDEKNVIDQLAQCGLEHRAYYFFSPTGKQYAKDGLLDMDDAQQYAHDFE